MTTHGMFHWNELMTRDVAKAKDFYAESLGWTFNDMPMGDGSTYTIIMMGDQMVGGMFPISGPMFENMPEGWFSYVAVDDVDARLKKATAAGGMVLREPWDVPGVGRIAIIQIPGGAGQGWMVPAPPPA